MLITTTQKLALILACLVIQSCTGVAKFEDISQAKKYSGLINNTYKTKIVFLVHGVNMDKPIGKDIHQYFITPRPGIGGRDIKSQNELGIGSIIKIIKIRKCTNCFLDFSPRIDFEVKILSLNKFKNYRKYLDSSFGDKKISLIKNHTAIMNPDYFSPFNNGS